MATEKRLIYADEIEDLFYKQVEWGATDLMDAFDDALNDAQTVDAVEVVRCKDCGHWLKDVPGCTETIGRCRFGNYIVGTNGYCVYGERRNNATD